MNPLLVLDVVRFEIRRSLSPGRTGIWSILVLFPIALVAAIRLLSDRAAENSEAWGMALYFLIPEVVCLLGLLLWATPAVSTEVEGQTWIYLAMRSTGRNLVLIGKYLTAVLWSCSAACVAATYAAGRSLNDAFDIHHQVQGSGSGIDVASSIERLFECKKH